MTAVLIWAVVGCLTSASAQSATYSYDALGRLTLVNYSNGSATAYSYDAAGNRTQVNTTASNVSASLSASPTTIVQSASTTLTWSTANATSASINNGVGAVTPVAGGTLTVTPSTTTTYTLTATGPGGSATSQATVNVNDISPTPWTWANQSISTASNYGGVNTPSHTLSGFNQSVTLRAQAGGVTGNVDAAAIYVFKNGVNVGTYNFISNPSGYVDLSVQPGDVIYLHLAAQTFSAAQSGAATINLRNVTDGNTLLSSFNLSMTVGTNDPSVNSWSWPNQSLITASNYTSVNSPIQTLTGFNLPVTLRVATPSVSGNVSAGGLYAVKNDLVVGSYEFMGNPNGYVDVSVLPNDTLKVFTDVQTWVGYVTGNATVTVRNLSDSNALLTSYSLNMAIGPDYSVTPWSWGTQTINTTATYGSALTPIHTLAGFNQTVTLRFSSASLTGNISAAGIYVAKNGSTVGNYNLIADPGGYVDVTANAGDTTHIYLDAQSWAGPATGSVVISVRNLSDSNALVSSFTLNMAVDQ